MANRFSEALRAVVPAHGADERAWAEAIEKIADLVLRRCTWMIANKPHRFTEVEFYVTNSAHNDPFTHGDEMQHEFARWYHHRTGGEYRGGTYKGLDLAFGDEHTYAGMLVRGIESTDSPAKLLDGPCVCVDHLLSLVGHPSVPSFVASYDRDADEKPSSPSYLRVSDAPDLPLFRSARVGLSLKRGATASRVKFIGAHYRFLTEPARIKKGRVLLVCAMHARGASAAAIAASTGTRLAQVQKYIEQYELGRSRDPAEFRGDLSADELCQMLGACAARAT
ncbi:MAG: hypothetical protein U0269_32735 [Polyangiales bacterium]